MKFPLSIHMAAAILLLAGCGAACRSLSAQELPAVGSQNESAPKPAPVLPPVGTEAAPPQKPVPASAPAPIPAPQPPAFNERSWTPRVEGQMELRNTAATELMHIVVGQSTVLRGVTPFKRIYIGNPAVLQSFTAGPSELVLTAKATGISSLVLWDTVGKSRLYTVQADADPDALHQALHAAFPANDIQVEGREGRLVLTGAVSTPELSDSMSKLASLYGNVVNSLRIVPIHEKQVQLKLRIVEVDRSKLEQYGVNLSGLSSNTPFSVGTGQFPSTISTSTTSPSGTTSNAVTPSDPLNLFLYSTKLNFGVTVKALEQKQILQVLAEPTLTAISGRSAKFLSGGEFPFPVAQSGNGSAPTVSISFRPYGVRLDFTPTVNDDGTIRLKIAPEVSSLDFSNAVTISGFVVPALSTKRAETEVEIKNGQSFALTGLLDHRTTETLSQIPGIARIPIIGKLFVAKSYSHSIVELVVMVTATVVDPLNDASTPTPEPTFIVPNLDAQTFDRDVSREQNIQKK